LSFSLSFVVVVVFGADSAWGVFLVLLLVGVVWGVEAGVDEGSGGSLAGVGLETTGSLSSRMTKGLFGK
jgi:hypothetical protein